MEICKYYDSIASDAMGMEFDSILSNESDRDYITGYDFREYVGSRYYLMRDYIKAFESIASYLQTGDLYARCLESAEIETDSFLGSIIAGKKPLELLAYYNRLCELNRQRGYYNDEVDHLRSLPIIERFIIVCERQALLWWQMEIESLPERWESLEVAK